MRRASGPSRTAGAGSSARFDHATDELVGWKATKRGDRWAALEPLYQGVRYAFGRLGKDVARGLTVAFIERYNAEWLVERHDHCTPRAICAKLQAAA